MPNSVRFVAGRAAVAGERRRNEIARAVKPQQREIAGLVLGDTVGVAEAGHRDRLAFVGDLAERDEIAAAVTTIALPYSTPRLCPAAAAGVTDRGIRSKVSATAIATGAMVPSVA